MDQLAAKRAKQMRRYEHWHRWVSKALADPRLQTIDWEQRLSNWLAPRVLSVFGVSKTPLRAEQRHTVLGIPTIVAVLETDDIPLPDIAARALIWLIVVLFITVIVFSIWIYAIYRLQRITATAYEMTVKPSSTNATLSVYTGSRDEIGTLASVLEVLIRRSRSRSAIVLNRVRKEEAHRTNQMRRESEYARNRQAILDAIGHEIRSPLQSLLNKVTPDSDFHSGLVRMQNAVQALFLATSVEEGIKSGDIVLKSQDLSEYVYRYAKNLSSDGLTIVYHGMVSGVSAEFDAIVLSQVFDGIIENARRYSSEGTAIDIRFDIGENDASITLFNIGPPVSFAEIDSIFTYGVTDSLGPEHKGQGLFAARVRVLAMRGTIQALNRENGVAFVITLPLSPSDKRRDPR